MGASQSAEATEEETEEEEDEEEDDHGEAERRELLVDHLGKKVLEQEPEILPCYASASPLSPQLSTLGTPRLGPSIKVWDPYNVLSPPPPMFSRSFSSSTIDDDRVATEVFLISHGECELNLRPDLVAGRCPLAALTVNGKRQARALAVFLKSQGIRFNAVYSSPLDRARSMAVSTCQEMNFAEDRVHSSDALVEMSQGNWEGCMWSETYTPEILNLMDRLQPDFTPPSGESLRQVEFRMVDFLNSTVLGLDGKLRSDISQHALTSSLHEGNGTHWDLNNRWQGSTRKKYGKSRLQIVTSNGDQEADDETSPHDANYGTSHHDLSVRGSSSYSSYCVALFTHSVPIKCLLTGLLGCSPTVSHKICIEDSSITVIQHSWKTGWQIKRLNDTAHLRLL